jgi:hypothetical protein
MGDDREPPPPPAPPQMLVSGWDTTSQLQLSRRARAVLIGCAVLFVAFIAFGMVVTFYALVVYPAETQGAGALLAGRDYLSDSVQI